MTDEQKESRTSKRNISNPNTEVEGNISLLLSSQMCVKEGKIRILNVQFAFRVWGTWAIEWLDECYLGRYTRRKKRMLRMAIEFRVNGSVWPNEMMIIISRIQSQLTPPSSSRSVCRKFIYTSILGVIHPPQQMPSHLFHFLIIITIIVIKYPPT